MSGGITEYWKGWRGKYLHYGRWRYSATLAVALLLKFVNVYYVVQLFSDIQKDEQREGRKDNVYP
jgi:hypothetical protein